MKRGKNMGRKKYIAGTSSFNHTQQSKKELNELEKRIGESRTIVIRRAISMMYDHFMRSDKKDK